MDYTFPYQLFRKLLSLEKQSTVWYGIKHFGPKFDYLIVNLGDVIETAEGDVTLLQGGRC